jgi:hypothetical protein
MNYTKPQITNTEDASLAIMGGKDDINVSDSNFLHSTAAAYSADE